MAFSIHLCYLLMTAIYSDTLCCYALALLGSRGLLSILLAWYKNFIASVP